MPPRSKKATHERNTANHSHSLGLAAPGRRVSRQKSHIVEDHGELTVSSSSSSTVADAANGLPISRLVSECDSHTIRVDDSPVCSDVRTSDRSTDDLVTMGSTQSHPAVCKRRTVLDRSDVNAETRTDACPFSFSPTTVNLDVNTAASGKVSRKRKSNLAVATTILSACPLWDVIAILIILLQLPPTVISIVHGLFALMTFVPPPTSLSLGNLPTFHDLIAIDPAGAPSIQTILFVDALLMLCFVWLAVPAQNIILDLAQAVIAIALGGAAASHGSTTKSVICCLGIISASHILAWKSVRNFGFKLFASFQLDLPYHTTHAKIPFFHDRLHTFPGKARSILGAHILAQGLLKGVRRYISWFKNQSELRSNPTRGDQEMPVNGSTAMSPAACMEPHENPDVESVKSGDGRPPGLPPTHTSRDKLVNGKRKNKRLAAQVRFQQPFWAALASTKVTVAKEYEQSRAFLDAQDAQAADVTHLGDICFASSRDRVWIMDVGDIDISLGISFLLNKAEENGKNKTEDMQSPRWCIKINGAPWHSVDSSMLGRTIVDEDMLERWEVRIYDLAPLSSYYCEVVMEDGQEVMYEASIITQPAPCTKMAATALPAAQTLQPVSPTTTLRKSIYVAELEAEKVKNNLKAARKQHKSMLERLQSQLDREKFKLLNTGGSDERQRQRARQLENSILRIKSEHKEHQQNLDELGEIPASVKQAYYTAKDAARANQKRLDGQKSAYEQSKRDIHKRVALAQSELDAALHKQGRFEARQKEYDLKLVDLGKKVEQAAHAKAIRVNRMLENAAGRRQIVLQWEMAIAELERAAAEDQSSYMLVQQELKPIEEWLGSSAQGFSNISESPDNMGSSSHGPSAFSSPVGEDHQVSGSRPSSLHVSASNFSPCLVSPQLSAGHGSGPMQPGFGSLPQGRKRSCSLEAALKTNGKASSNATAYPTPFSTSALAAPSGFDSLSPASSAALLANSTALAPPPRPSSATSVKSKEHESCHKPAPTPVGAEKTSRRKGSSGSGHSLRDMNGTENGSPSTRHWSPTLRNGTAGKQMKNGVVSLV